MRVILQLWRGWERIGSFDEIYLLICFLLSYILLETFCDEIKTFLSTKFNKLFSEIITNCFHMLCEIFKDIVGYSHLLFTKI